MCKHLYLMMLVAMLLFAIACVVPVIKLVLFVLSFSFTLIITTLYSNQVLGLISACLVVYVDLILRDTFEKVISTQVHLPIYSVFRSQHNLCRILCISIIRWIWLLNIPQNHQRTIGYTCALCSIQKGVFITMVYDRMVYRIFDTWRVYYDIDSG